jgi:hypothetical protein
MTASPNEGLAADASSDFGRSIRISIARGRLGSRLRYPLSSSWLSWWVTLDSEERPTASPISRMLGG